MRFTKRLPSTVVLAFACVISGVPMWAQQSSHEEIVRNSLEKIGSSDVATRWSGFYEMLDDAGKGPVSGRTWEIPSRLETLFHTVPSQQAQVRATLVDLLSRENAAPADIRAREGFGGYYGDLIMAVSALRDTRAIPALIEALPTGNMAARGLAALGGDAVEPILQHARDSPITYLGSIRALGAMLDSQVVTELDARARARIKEALTVAASDPSRFVRLSAIEGLGRIPDSDVTLTLQRLAGTDPYSQIENQHTVYPIRDAARRALESQGRGSAR